MDYTNLYNFLDATGIIVPSTDAVKSGVETKFKEIFGADLDVSAETPVGRLIEAVCVLVRSSCGVTAQSANQFNINEATGVYLDAVAKIYELKRNPGTKTRIPVTVTMSAGGTDTVPAGSMIADSVGNLFTIDNDIVVTAYAPGATEGEASGTATAVEYGEVPGEAGTVTFIQSSVLGWKGVTNGEAMQIGNLVETDAAFRERLYRARPTGTGFRQSLLSALKRIDGVDSACVEENNDTPAMTVNGISMDGHTVYVCVYGPGSGAEFNNKVAKAVLDVKSAGVGMMHGSTRGTLTTVTNVPVGDSGNVLATVYFYRPATYTISVTVQVTNQSFVGSDGATAIKNAVAAYVNSVDIGSEVLGAEVAQAAMTAAPGCGVASVSMVRGSESAATNLKFYADMKPLCTADNVTVSLYSYPQPNA